MPGNYTYKCVAIPRDIAVIKKLFSGSDQGATVAGYIEQLINQHASENWEFYRMDVVNIVEKPGCLASLIGQREIVTVYNLVTFRKPK